MSSLPRAAVLSLSFAGALGTGGCTLVKPVVGAVTGPVYMLAHTGGDFGCGCGDGRVALLFLAAGAAVGAGAGLVTGLVSDLQAVAGNARDPMQNWWDPFATNCDPGRRP